MLIRNGRITKLSKNKYKIKITMLNIILDIFTIVGIYYFLLVVFDLIMPNLFGIKSLPEMASTIALIVILILTIVIEQL
nr:MAG TPA: hypothetical protein [Caudoviricetes sp.]